MKKMICMLLAMLLLCTVLCACTKDGGETESGTSQSEGSQTSSEKVPEGKESSVAATGGQELATAMWKLSYTEDWSYSEDSFSDSEDYAAVTLDILEGEEVLVSVHISSSLEDPGSYRDDLKYAGIDAYEMVENNAVPLVSIGGVDFVAYEGQSWGDTMQYYYGRVENAGVTAEISVSGAYDDPRVEALLNTLVFTLADTGNVDPPWPWNGTPFAAEETYTAAAGDWTVTSEWLPFADALVADDIFSGRIAVAGETLWVLLDGRLYAYTMGESLTLEQEVALEEDGYEELSADQDGNLYVSGFMGPMLKITDGKIVASYEDVDRTQMAGNGEWGISYFTDSVLSQVTLSGDAAALSEWITVDGADMISSVSLTPNYIFAAGSVEETQNHAIWVFDASGNQQFLLGNKEMEDPDWLGSVTQVVETENGFIALDGNLRNLCFWQKDGTFIAALEDGDLFGTYYPWISAAAVLPDGSVLVGLTEERSDKSADEFVVYRLSGF